MEILWCVECQMGSDEVMSHRGACQRWDLPKAASVSDQAVDERGVAYAAQGAGGDG